ncbi:UvrD/REP helicase N-terminal domain-containing protein [Pseudomonas linyingensis]|uniref:UvrD/REP helicase N-terminal domain-containing protein n=1 Tax=Pseudomonas linyingensis TaxID=915471 RepID=A0A1H6YXM8_9PSED|nr:DEAD/DEAH box helicase [Pseudomonas linyingensis]SEJ42132.1 UvrD/REP helicase N-terminal domain-containing protein [Pseudomonas linyingensis]
MLSAVKRYKLLLSAALARYFPRTTAYLRAEGEAALRHPRPGARANKVVAASGKARAASAKKPARPRAQSAQPAPVKPTQPAKRASEGIYGPAQMAVDAPQVQAMRERVGQAVQAGVISPPSDEQWAMILSSHPVTRVFAGAGSGKSTTLVLRVVFMLCHMGIPPERLTVISFTNASCAQLREQLIKVLSFWQYPFDAGMARQCVRTFHSAMAVLAKELLSNPQWFEQLDERNASATELDNPLAAARLKPAQQRLLKQAYQQCYAEEAGFRERVHSLLGLPPPPASDGEGKRSKVPRAPLDGFKLAGEFTPAPLFEVFHAQAGFMESIGIRIDQIQTQTLDCPAGERVFVEALALFWKYFETSLHEQGLLTFNGAFQQLTQILSSTGKGVPAQALAPFGHLLIDEFQDISPQIVQWLQALHRALARQGQAVSLMAIGDDWQSIYGWRGSSPELFMDFDKYFPGKGKAKNSAVLMLATNYRSIEPVIRDGEAVLAGVAFKQDKASQACKAVQPGDHGVKLVTRFDVKARLPELLKEIQAQCAHVADRPGADRTAVLVLSRRNEPLQRIQAELDRKLPVKAYTIHRAKGLQAEVAIIVDDCAPPERHPLRNALYAHSGFFRNSYDQAMQDESLRLAYVAITRGVSRVFWFTQRTQGATQILAARGSRRS